MPFLISLKLIIYFKPYSISNYCILYKVSYIYKHTHRHILNCNQMLPTLSNSSSTNGNETRLDIGTFWHVILYVLENRHGRGMMFIIKKMGETWWRHQMETFSALLAMCTGSFDVFFDLRLNKRLSKQSWGWWLETLSRPLWRHRNEISSCRPSSLWGHTFVTTGS